ncbi:zinc-dependent alcohol dehydrogenase family protein [Tepidiphilus baoligensis]|uniref:Alcohol dehydrogenase catalytic domain-containing protein n=1 Tax=Tepidiphilus baoligensis TaxID=2698687 RepID=A0ABX1QLM7_9PROT|nr:zinc-dependent alcohol dehydrogenase family protein [Tepidiphilus baoligensis]NMH16186.1 alcohol dehydrogenase catalytic domain-containing protein [Tepidiphilus baoligensis]
MKAAVMVKHREALKIDELPNPKPGPDDVVLRVEACGICRSDWHAWQGDWAWVGISPDLPIVPGHEIGGVVEEVGSNVKKYRKGDAVTVPFHSACGHCEYCLQGRPNICENVVIFGLSTGYNGGYAQYVVVRNADFNLIRLPENVDTMAAAAIGCRYMTAFHGVVRAGGKPGEWVAVHGAGGVGLSAVQIAAALGKNVIAVDIDQAKLEKAKQEGAVAVVNAKRDKVPEAIKEITKGGAHASIEALGVRETTLNSVLSLRRGGRHVQVGLTTKEEGGMISLPVDLFVALEAEFVGSFGNPHPDYAGLLALMSQGKLNPKSLISREVALEEVNDVFKAMSEYKTMGFNVITRF